MSDYDNTNKVSLWKNDNVKAKAPELKGTINVEGVEYQISLWKNENRTSDKQPILQGNIQPKVAGKTAPKAAAPAAKSTMDDDIPW